VEARVPGEARFGGAAHLGVGLDGVDGVAVLEERLGGDAGACADVRDDVLGP